MSRHIVVRLLVAAAVLTLTVSAAADLYTFRPNPSDLYDLDHDYAYQWGIGNSWLTDDYEVVGAQLTLTRIRNWDNSPNDLYIHLLGDLNGWTGVMTYRDNGGGGDYFENVYAGSEELLVQYHNLPSTAQTLVYTFNADQLALLQKFAAADTFGLGFDPDCHFYNDGIKLVIKTDKKMVPEPASLSLLGLGVAGLAVVRYRRK